MSNNDYSNALTHTESGLVCKHINVYNVLTFLPRCIQNKNRKQADLYTRKQIILGEIIVLYTHCISFLFRT